MYKKAYAILKNNMIFIQPVLLWKIAFSAVVLFSVNRIQAFVPRVTMWSSILLLFIACLAGWFHINKYAVLSYDVKDNQEQITSKTIQNFKKFFEGVGSDFFRTTLAFIVVVCIYFAVFYGLYKVCLANFGIPAFLEELIKMADSAVSQEQIMQLLYNTSDSDKLIFTRWVLTINTGISIVNFFVLLYFAVLSFERKNFIISFFCALKFFVVNIFESIGIMLFVFVLYLFISVLYAIFSANSLLFALLIIFLTLYLNYYVLLVFCFYYDKTKIDSNNRSECIRKDELSDKAGKEI